jgi:hypothetical protein
MKTKLVTVIVSTIFSISLSAEETNIPQQFRNLDSNNDGTITINEATGHLNLLRNWATIDSDLNGTLEISEFSAFESAVEYVPDDSKVEESDNIGAAPH